MSRRERDAVRALLERRGLRAHRDRGQNFLVDPGWATRIAGYAELSTEDAVIEVGPGLGILTRALAERAGAVAAIEIDRGLVAALREEGELPDHVELIHDDALRVDLPALSTRLRERHRRLCVVANLPYSVSSPIIRWLLDARDALESCVLLLQREVAERLVAPSGSRAYNSLAVLIRAVAAVERLADVPAACFQPVPQVVSTLVRITPEHPTPISDISFERLEALTRAAFKSRRKTIFRALHTHWPFADIAVGEIEVHLDRAEIARERRAEQLEPDDFLRLVNSLRGDFPSQID